MTLGRVMLVSVLVASVALFDPAAAEYVGIDDCDEDNPDYNCCPWGPRFPTVDIEPGDFDDCLNSIRLPYMP